MNRRMCRTIVFLSIVAILICMTLVLPPSAPVPAHAAESATVNLASSQLGTAATASSVSTDRPPSNANDDNSASCWGPLTSDNNTGEVWLSLNFGKYTTFDRVKIDFMPSGTTSQLPTGYAIKVLTDPFYTDTYAANPSKWKTVATRASNDYPNAADDLDLPAQTSTRLTVVLQVDPTKPIPRICDIQVFDMPSVYGAINWALSSNGSEATASSTSTDRVPRKANDGNALTNWGPLTSDKNTGEVWLTLDFKRNATFDRVKLDFEPAGANAALPLSYTIKVLDDPAYTGTYAANPSKWLTVVSRTASSHYPNASDDVAFSVETAARLTVVFQVNPASPIPRINEIEVYQTASDSFDALREERKEKLIGGTYNPQDPDIAAVIASADSTAVTYLNSMIAPNNSQKYLWSDLAAGDINATETSYNRLLAMARAYATTGSGLSAATKTQLRDAIVTGLEFLNDNWYNSNISNDSWYKFEIGVPKKILDILVLLYDDLAAMRKLQLLDDHLAAIRYFSPHPAHMQVTTSDPRYFYLTGANLAEKSFDHALLGILGKKAADIELARQSISPIWDYVTTGDGFYTDGSFIQHNDFAYTGSYGLVLLGAAVSFLDLLSDSAWEYTDPRSANLYKWVYDSFEPLFYRGLIMDMSRGRAVARANSQDWTGGRGFLNTLSNMAEFAPPADAANFKGIVKRWVGSPLYGNYFSGLSIHNIGLIKSIINDPSVQMREMPVYHKTFASMDRVVHHRPDFSLALSLSSERISNYEYLSTNKENGRGYYTADGMTYLYNGDLKQFSDAFWPTVDPKRLPGITVDYGQTRTYGSGQSYNSPENWVGGSNISQLYGTAGMLLNGWDNTLAAKKSWFMFDDEIVALGSGISSTDNRTIETVVDNRMLNAAGNNSLQVNGSAKPTSIPWSQTMTGVNWTHLAGSVANSDIGYYFPGGATIKGLREARTGSWTDINESSGTPTTLYTRNYLSLRFDHGTNPSNATYAYAILPNKTATEVGQYAANPDFEVIANTSEVQSVRENNLNIDAANFWVNAVRSAGIIKSNKKSSVMTRITGNSLEVSVSDPTQATTGNITIEIAKAASALVTSDPRITITRLSPTIQMEVNVNGAKGRSIQAIFTLIPPENQIVSLTTADAFIKGGSDAGVNFGTADELLVKASPSAELNRKIYMKFDLSQVNSASGAVLELYGNSETTVTGSVKAYKASSDNWSETAITWNNAPGRSSTPLDSLRIGTYAQTYVFDVTSAVQEALASNKVLTLVLEGEESENMHFRFNSREAGANQPRLRIY